MANDRETLLALAQRAEEARGPDRELLEAIDKTLKPQEWANDWLDPTRHALPDYLSSLDAAMTLVPEGCWADCGQGETRPWACVTNRGTLHDYASVAATPALALTAACLRAKAASLQTEGSGG